MPISAQLLPHQRASRTAPTSAWSSRLRTGRRSAKASTATSASFWGSTDIVEGEVAVRCDDGRVARGSHA